MATKDQVAQLIVSKLRLVGTAAMNAWPKCPASTKNPGGTKPCGTPRAPPTG